MYPLASRFQKDLPSACGELLKRQGSALNRNVNLINANTVITRLGRELLLKLKELLIRVHRLGTAKNGCGGRSWILSVRLYKIIRAYLGKYLLCAP